MSASTSPRSTPLSIERIVDVDPMAVYHHVAGKRELLALVTARTIATMTPPDPTAPWDTRVRQWAMNYWELVAKHRDLTLAGLADPEIAAGGLPSTESLITAIADSGLPADLVEPTAYIVVDAVHGAALSGVPTGTGRSRNRGLARLRATFAVGLDTIVAGIAARAATKRRRT